MAGLIATLSQAQEIPDRRPGKEDNITRDHRGGELEKLNLSEEQKAKFKSLREENRKQMEELKKNDNITVREWRATREALRKEHREKVQSLLTNEQKAQLEKSRQERKVQMEERAKTRPDSYRVEKMKQELNLTEEQSAKLKSNREALQQKMRTLREDKTLSDEAKREQMRELMKQRKVNLRSILTEDQWKKLQDERPNRHSRRKTV